MIRTASAKREGVVLQTTIWGWGGGGGGGNVLTNIVKLIANCLICLAPTFQIFAGGGGGGGGGGRITLLCIL